MSRSARRRDYFGFAPEKGGSEKARKKKAEHARQGDGNAEPGPCEEHTGDQNKKKNEVRGCKENQMPAGKGVVVEPAKIILCERNDKADQTYYSGNDISMPFISVLHVHGSVR